MAIEFDLNTYLRSKTPVTDIVSDQIRPLRRRQSDSGAAITYRRKRGGHNHNLTGDPGYTNATIELICWSQSYDTVKALSDAVRNEMQGFSGTFDSTQVFSVKLLDEEDDFVDPEDGSDDGWFATVLDYLVVHVNSIATPS